jgi:hypothetical protein
MWIIYALGSALFAGITSILAKAGIKETSSNVATAIRTDAAITTPGTRESREFRDPIRGCWYPSWSLNDADPSPQDNLKGGD